MSENRCGDDWRRSLAVISEPNEAVDGAGKPGFIETPGIVEKAETHLADIATPRRDAGDEGRDSRFQGTRQHDGKIVILRPEIGAELDPLGKIEATMNR